MNGSDDDRPVNDDTPNEDDKVSLENVNERPLRRSSNRVRGIPPDTPMELPRYGVNDARPNVDEVPRSLSAEYGRPLRRCWSGRSADEFDAAIRTRNKSRDRLLRQDHAAAVARELRYEAELTAQSRDVADLRLSDKPPHATWMTYPRFDHG